MRKIHKMELKRLKELLVLKELNQLLFHNALSLEDISSCPPTNHTNVSDSNNEYLNKVDEGVSRFLIIWSFCVLSPQSL